MAPARPSVLLLALVVTLSAIAASGCLRRDAAPPAADFEWPEDDGGDADSDAGPRLPGDGADSGNPVGPKPYPGLLAGAAVRLERGDFNAVQASIAYDAGRDVFLVGHRGVAPDGQATRLSFNVVPGNGDAPRFLFDLDLEGAAVANPVLSWNPVDPDAFVALWVERTRSGEPGPLRGLRISVDADAPGTPFLVLMPATGSPRATPLDRGFLVTYLHANPDGSADARAFFLEFSPGGDPGVRQPFHTLIANATGIASVTMGDEVLVLATRGEGGRTTESAFVMGLDAEGAPARRSTSSREAVEGRLDLALARAGDGAVVARTHAGEAVTVGAADAPGAAFALLPVAAVVTSLACFGEDCLAAMVVDATSGRSVLTRVANARTSPEVHDPFVIFESYATPRDARLVVHAGDARFLACISGTARGGEIFCAFVTLDARSERG